ncbi:MAG: extracellular solute-binding protein, partial [Cohnella sp.]|nr:extracellular solute-binding protein [Cohnella sp.]
MKKSGTALTAVAVAATLITACSSGGSGGSAAVSPIASPGASASPTAAAVKAPVTLTAKVQNHPSTPFKEDWLVWSVYEKKANVKIQASGYQGNWWETIPLVIASRDMPDLMWMSGTDMIHKYGDEGALVNLKDQLDKMPNLAKFIKEHPNETAGMLSATGKLYVPPTSGAYAAVSSLFMYRKDIFDKHKLEQPKNYEEFYQVLKKLKELYPDSYPVTFQKLNDVMYSLTESWGTGVGYYYNNKTKAMSYGPMENNFRDMITWVNKLYKEKLIPIDFLSLDEKQRNELVTTNKTFLVYGYLNNIDTYNSAARKTNPEYTLAGMIPPEGPGGRYSARQSFISEGWGVTTTSKKIDDALKLIDWQFSEAGKEALSWGLEGVTYNKVNGQNKFVDAVKDMATATREYGLKSSGNFPWYDEN